MRQCKRFAVLLMVISSFFMTGCDASKILDVIQKVAEGVQKAIPAIKQVNDTVSNTVNSTNTDTTTNNTATATSTSTETDANNASVTVTNPTDDEEVGTSTTTSTSTSTATSTDTSAAEAALANYRGGRLSPSEFARLFGPVAREASKKSGVPASIILAQAALETGWGGSTIGDAKNLFGIKGTGPAGSIRVPTEEVINGQRVTINDNFRKYNSWQESIEDHGRLLQNSRYARAMAVKNDPDQFARELQKAGYATDPEYASKLISIMKSNNLYQYNN